MQVSAAELRILSERFYGNKRFFATHFMFLKDCYNDEQKITNLLEEIYSDYYKEVCKTGKERFLTCFQDVKLLPILIQFVINQLSFCYDSKFNFEKSTCLLELSMYLFQKCWERRWNKDKAFEEFRQTLVRHSLFRPPQSIFLYTLEEIKLITMHFLNTFFRYYTSYFFSFTPLVDLVVKTEEVLKKYALDLQRKLRSKIQENQRQKVQGRRQNNIMMIWILNYLNSIHNYWSLYSRLMKGNSIHQIPEKKRQELMRMKQMKEKQERIDRILKQKLAFIEEEFEGKIKEQDEDFVKKIDEIKNPPKKK